MTWPDFPPRVRAAFGFLRGHGFSAVDPQLTVGPFGDISVDYLSDELLVRVARERLQLEVDFGSSRHRGDTLDLTIVCDWLCKPELRDRLEGARQGSAEDEGARLAIVAQVVAELLPSLIAQFGGPQFVEAWRLVRAHRLAKRKRERGIP